MAEAIASPRLGRQALRMALAGTLAFAFAEYQGWEFSFLAPMLAVQFLGALPSGIRREWQPKQLLSESWSFPSLPTTQR